MAFGKKSGPTSKPQPSAGMASKPASLFPGKTSGTGRPMSKMGKKDMPKAGKAC